MKEVLSKLLPNRVKNSLKPLFYSMNLSMAYYRDFQRFNSSGFNMKDNNSFENLRSKITFHAHALEKGMSNSNLRLGFGKNALKGLFDSMHLYKQLNYPLSDIRYRMALSTIEQYIQLHNDYNFKILGTENKYNQLITNYDLAVENIGGYYELNKEDIVNCKDSSFDKLVKKRYSVRDFSEEPVDLKLLENAIQIAVHTPSACNRQAWKVYIIKNIEMINALLIAQGGLNGFGKNLETILVVTCDNQYFSGFHERNQSFIDGGMFAMTLLYALENQGLASCALNASLYKENENKIRSDVGINRSEDIILFISVGNYPDEFKVAKSYRDHDIINYRL